VNLGESEGLAAVGDGRARSGLSSRSGGSRSSNGVAHGAGRGLGHLAADSSGRGGDNSRVDSGALTTNGGDH
jgi:hypothetical protein